MQSVLDGTAHGLSAGVDASRIALRSSLPIMRSVSEHPYVMGEYMVTAIAKGRVAGPFPSPSMVTLPGNPSPTKPFRLLRRRPRFAVPGTPVAARLSGCAVVFAAQVAFLPVPRGISGW